MVFFDLIALLERATIANVEYVRMNAEVEGELEIWCTINLCLLFLCSRCYST